MKLIVEEIRENFSLYQQILVTENLDIIAIRPRIYKHQNPAGQLQIKITDLNNKLIAESDQINIIDINSAAYSHTYYKFPIVTQLLKNQEYRIYLHNFNYTFSELNWAGWCKALDLVKTNCSYAPCANFNSPFDFEIWIKKRG
mgnify:CR=1 FL=1